VTCHNEEKLRDIENKFIQCTTGMVIVVDKDKTSISGLLPLHDLLRAQAAIMEQ
jgi:hypothetical protein